MSPRRVEVRRQPGAAKPVRQSRSKYRNVKVEVDGHVFDSKKEARRYGELKLLEQAHEILDLELQPKFPLHVWVVPEVKIGTYSADFCYMDKDGVFHVEDVKSSATKTQLYRWKKKHVKAEYGIDIEEV